MKPLASFIARVKANKVTTTSAIIVAACWAVLKYPSITEWMPPEVGKPIWNFAHDNISVFIGSALLFVKQHGSVGDPAKTGAVNDTTA